MNRRLDRSDALRALACLLVLLPLAAGRAAALRSVAPADAAACQAAIEGVERTISAPRELLSAIARTESGRVFPPGRVVAWPWTINVAGAGHFYESAQDAITAVEGFRAAGIQSIDVGCMQVNLMHHPNAFATLQQAFDPATNAAYAARFLTELYAEMGDWPKAVAAYHSRTPVLASDYGRRVMQAWPLAAAYGGGSPMAERTRLPVIDPYGVYTPEFARRLADDAAARAARDRGLRIASNRLARHQTGFLTQRFPSLLRVPSVVGGARLAQLDLLRTHRHGEGYEPAELASR